jgi:lysophospholipase L1-like esterase
MAVASAEPVPTQVPASQAASRPRIPSPPRDLGPIDPDAPLEIEDPSGEALLSFFEALRRAEAALPEGRVAVVQFGDSHTAADFGTGRLRRKLQSRFGDAGRGFLLPGRPFRSYYQRDVRLASEGKWEVQNGLRVSAQEPFGMAGIRSISSSSKSIGTVQTCDGCGSKEATRLELFYRSFPEGGGLKLMVDDQPHAEFSTKESAEGPGTVGGYWSVEVPSGPHKLSVQPVGDGPVELFGVVLERDTPGVVLDALGVNGAQILHLLRWDWSFVGEQLARRDPRLVILAYGTNESANQSLSLDTLAANLEEAIVRVKTTVPGASILVLGPPDRNVRERNDCDKPKKKSKKKNSPKVQPLPEGEVAPGCEWKTPLVIPEIVEVERAVAAQQGVAFFDTYLSMGGSGSMELWNRLSPPLAQRDHTHLSKEGYEANADALFDALMRSYERYLTVAPPLP